MPEATKYNIRPESDMFKAIDDAHIKEARERLDKIKRAWDYYHGQHEKPLKKQKDGYDDNVIINHVETLAEKLAAFLIGDGVMFDAGSDDDLTDTPDTQIKQLWGFESVAGKRLNRGQLLQNNLALSGAIEGHCAVRLEPPTDAQGNIIPNQYPRIIRLQQRHFSVFWDAFDMQRVLWYRLQTSAGGKAKRIDYVRGTVDREAPTDEQVDHSVPIWTEVTWESDVIAAPGISNPGRWKLVDVSPLSWEWPPIVEWQNLPNPNYYYGKCDVTSAIELNRALNFVYSNTMRIVKHHAHPKTVALGVQPAEIVPSAVGGLWTINKPASEVSVNNLEMQSDGALSQWLSQVLAESLWQSGGVVDPQTIKDKVGALTNFGLRVLFTDAIRRTEKKRLLYGEGFEQINRYGLMMANITPPETITTIWPEVLPLDDETIASVLLEELGNGIISKETYRERRDYNHEQEMQRIEDEAAQTPNPLAGLLSGNGFNNIGFNRG